MISPSGSLKEISTLRRLQKTNHGSHCKILRVFSMSHLLIKKRNIEKAIMEIIRDL